MLKLKFAKCMNFSNGFNTFNNWLFFPILEDKPKCLNPHYFHIIGDGHQPNSRGLYTHYKDSLLFRWDDHPQTNATFDHGTNGFSELPTSPIREDFLTLSRKGWRDNSLTTQSGALGFSLWLLVLNLNVFLPKLEGFEQRSPKF